MSFFNRFFDKRNQAIRFGNIDVEGKKFGMTHLYNPKGEPIIMEHDITIPTPSEDTLLEESYSLTDFVKSMVQQKNQSDSRIADLEQKVQVLLSTQTIQPSTTETEFIKKYDFSGNHLTEFQEAVLTTDALMTIDLGWTMENLWKIEVRGKSSTSAMGNLIIKDESDNIILDTGIWNETDAEYENPKSVILTENRIKDVRNIKVGALWSALEIEGITFYYKGGLNVEGDLGSIVDTTYQPPPPAEPFSVDWTLYPFLEHEQQYDLAGTALYFSNTLNDIGGFAFNLYDEYSSKYVAVSKREEDTFTYIRFENTLNPSEEWFEIRFEEGTHPTISNKSDFFNATIGNAIVKLLTEFNWSFYFPNLETGKSYTAGTTNTTYKLDFDLGFENYNGVVLGGFRLQTTEGIDVDLTPYTQIDLGGGQIEIVLKSSGEEEMIISTQNGEGYGYITYVSPSLQQYFPQTSVVLTLYVPQPTPVEYNFAEPYASYGNDFTQITSGTEYTSDNWSSLFMDNNFSISNPTSNIGFRLNNDGQTHNGILFTTEETDVNAERKLVFTYNDMNVDWNNITIRGGDTGSMNITIKLFDDIGNELDTRTFTLSSSSNTANINFGGINGRRVEITTSAVQNTTFTLQYVLLTTLI